MLTKGGFAMTFPLDMENSLKSFDSEQTAEELSRSGSDSAKINLRSVAYRYMPSSPYSNFNHLPHWLINYVEGSSIAHVRFLIGRFT
jgi:hypothetical protein